ncbi:hypothetical protein [Aureimonas sp. Leaf454]|uniref:hypothetical protein n=1 Tax=Aureimonas sp. Leaf454 TaxID=1736381 RepID=UPI000A92D898|nr:hypothetical protein [Aureimonas sp. Leaf454]
MNDLLQMLGLLNEKPSRRFPWINWIVWGIAIVGIGITILYYGLLASHHLTGWPAS